MSGNYDDIINLPHHVSENRPQMSIHDRAAQFAPFAALVGYDSAVRETARLTEEQSLLDEDEKSVLNEKLSVLIEHRYERPAAAITFFVPDGKKCGGEYVTAKGIFRRIDEIEHAAVLEDGTKIPIEAISSIEVFLPEEKNAFD